MEVGGWVASVGPSVGASVGVSVGGFVGASVGINVVEVVDVVDAVSYTHLRAHETPEQSGLGGVG